MVILVKKDTYEMKLETRAIKSLTLGEIKKMKNNGFSFYSKPVKVHKK